MATCEWVFCSDWHLGKLKKLFPETHLKLVMEEVRKPFDYAIKNGIKYVIHGGDLFDSPIIDHKYSRAVIKLLLQYPTLKVIIIAGNHDIEDSENNSLHLITLCAELGVLPHVRVLHERIKITLDGIPFNFMPFPCTKLSKKQVINIAHIEVSGALRDNGQMIKKGIDIDNQDSLNFIGHIHKSQQIGKNTFFVGGLYQTNFGEQGTKGWFHVTTKFSTKFKNNVRFIKNDCGFELINLHISIEDDFKNLSKSETTLYKLHLKDGISVPPKLTMKYPNIVSVVGFKGGEELALFDKVLPPEMYDGEGSEVDLLTGDPIWGLLEFLKNEGLKKIQRKRAIQLVEGIVNNTQL